MLEDWRIAIAIKDEFIRRRRCVTGILEPTTVPVYSMEGMDALLFEQLFQLQKQTDVNLMRPFFSKKKVVNSTATYRGKGTVAYLVYNEKRAFRVVPKRVIN